MDRICFACNIKRDKDNYKHHRSVCKVCYKILKRKYNKKLVIQHRHQTFSGNDSINNNKALDVGPLLSTIPHVMLNILTRIPDRVIYITTKSPREHYSNF